MLNHKLYNPSFMDEKVGQEIVPRKKNTKEQ